MSRENCDVFSQLLMKGAETNGEFPSAIVETKTSTAYSFSDESVSHPYVAKCKPTFRMLDCGKLRTMLAAKLKSELKVKPLPYRQVIAIILSVLMTILLGISALRYVADIWIFSFFYSFQTHFGVLCALGAIIIWVIHKHWYSVALLALSLMIIAHSVVLKREFAPAISMASSNLKSYKLIAFNILGSNWDNGETIANMITKSDADVVYILEAPPLEDYLDELDRTYPHRIGCGNDTDTCDLMMLSKRPFTKKTVTSLSDLRRDRLMMADIELDGTLTHFVAVHLSKPYFDLYHREELYNLLQLLPDDDKPLIVAGDFNASILEPDMGRFLRRTEMQTGPAEPKTWPIRAGQFGIAIDHVFSRAPLYLTSVRNTDSNYGSNHNGLVAEFVLGK